MVLDVREREIPSKEKIQYTRQLLLMILGMEGATGQGMWVASMSWEWPASDREEVDGGPHLTTASNWILPTELKSGFLSRTSRKQQSPSWHLEVVLVRPWAENPSQDSWLTESQANKWMWFWAAMFGIICYTAMENQYSSKPQSSFKIKTFFHLLLWRSQSLCLQSIKFLTQQLKHNSCLDFFINY